MASIGNRARQNGSAKDLDAKIKESFNISGSTQKASFKFQEPARRTGKRPQHTVYKPSSTSADWNSLALKTDDFITPVHQYNTRPLTMQHGVTNFQQQPNYLMAMNPLTGQASQNQMPHNAHYQNQMPHNAQQQWGPNVQSSAGFTHGNFDSSFEHFKHQPNTNSHSLYYNMPGCMEPSNETRLTNQQVDTGNTPGVKANSYFGQLPSWMINPHEIPIVYKEVIKLCALPNNYADTAKLYPIFVSSQLPQDVLGHIWSAANKTTPGQLTFSEVYIALALIGLAQIGEMNLSVDFVKKLKSAPIPALQCMQKDVRAFVAPTIAPNTPIVSNNIADDDFADFQSVPHVPVSKNHSSSSWGNKSSDLTDESFQDESFQDFQSFTPSITNTNSMMTLDDSNKLSGTFTGQNNAEVKEPNLSSSILFATLPTPPKNTKILNTTNSKPIFENFSVVPPIIPTGNVAENSGKIKPLSLFGDTVVKPLEDSTSKSTGSLRSETLLDNSKFTIPFPSKTSVGDSQKNDSAGDKYSALRDLTSISFSDAKTSEESDTNFDLIGPEPVATGSTLFPIANEPEVKEKPSTPVKEQNQFENEQNLFENFSNFTQTPPIMTSCEPAATDDGLYSLDEPISPLSERRNRNDIKPIPMSPPKSQRFVIPKRISEADSDDFGEFSSGPPPIDDLDIGESDMYHNGNSSLVDFDAFDDFESAQETKKTKDREIKGKHDGTAFSEILVGQSSTEKFTASNTTVDGASNDDTKNTVSEGVWSESISDFSEYKVDDTSIQSIAESNNDTVKKKKMNTTDVNNISGCITRPELSVEMNEGTVEVHQSIEEPKWDRGYEELRAIVESSVRLKPMEIYADHWGRCLVICKDIIASTSNIFAALNSPLVCLEIVNSTRGKDFISCTSEVYGVARRIRKGMESVGLENEDLEMTLKDIEISWNNLLGFCPYTPSVHKTPEHCCTPSGKNSIDVNGADGSSACGLCLLSTSGEWPVGLECGGKLYHAPCANLWLNQVTPILPRLQVPTV
ncbi:synergin gamma-like [Styela clava]